MLKQLLFCLYLFSTPLIAADNRPKIVIEEPADQLPAQADNFNVQAKFSRILLTLGGLILAIFLISFFFKKISRQRMESANASSGIKVLERRPLTAKTTLYVIQAHNKTLLIGDASGELVALAELSLRDESAPSDEGAPLSFTQVLKKKLNEFKS